MHESSKDSRITEMKQVEFFKLVGLALCPVEDGADAPDSEEKKPQGHAKFVQEIQMIYHTEEQKKRAKQRGGGYD